MRRGTQVGWGSPAAMPRLPCPPSLRCPPAAGLARPAARHCAVGPRGDEHRLRGRALGGEHAVARGLRVGMGAVRESGGGRLQRPELAGEGPRHGGGPRRARSSVCALRVPPSPLPTAPTHAPPCRPVSAVAAVACGWRHSVALTADGDLWTFGWSKYGQLGHGDFVDQLRPKKIEDLAGQVQEVSGGWRHTVALTKAGQVRRRRGGSARGLYKLSSASKRRPSRVALRTRSSTPGDGASLGSWGWETWWTAAPPRSYRGRG